MMEPSRGREETTNLQYMGTGEIKQVLLGRVAQGAYWVRVTNGMNSKAKKLLVH